MEEFSRLKSDRDERLEQLEGCLTELPQIGLNYARYLRDIELHQTTIETNAKNYSGWLKQLGDYSVQEMDNLDFIQNFVDWSCPKFQNQIKVYMSYLTVGRQLFQQMIETIRGIVEVDAQKQQIKYEKVEKDARSQFTKHDSSSRYRHRCRSRCCRNLSSRLPLNRKTLGFPFSPTSSATVRIPSLFSLLLSCCTRWRFGIVGLFVTKRLPQS